MTHLQAEEQAAQYPRIPHALSTKMYEGREPKKVELVELFKRHQEKFDTECKSKMFEFGEEVLYDEANRKYDRVSGQAKINFLALGKKS